MHSPCPLQAFQKSMKNSQDGSGAACSVILKALERGLHSNSAHPDSGWGDQMDDESALRNLCCWSLDPEIDLETMVPSSQITAAARLLFQHLLPRDALGQTLEALDDTSPVALRRKAWTCWLANCDAWLLEEPLSLERMQAANAIADAWDAHQRSSLGEWQDLACTGRRRMLHSLLRPVQPLIQDVHLGAASLANWLQHRLAGLKLIWPGSELFSEEERLASQNILSRFSKFCVQLDEPIRILLSDHIREELLLLVERGQQGDAVEDSYWQQLHEELQRWFSLQSSHTPLNPLEESAQPRIAQTKICSHESAHTSEARRPHIERFLQYPGWGGTAGGPGSTPRQAALRFRSGDPVALGSGNWAAALFWPDFQPTQVLRDLQLTAQWEARLHRTIQHASFEDLSDGIVEGDDQLSELLTCLCGDQPSARNAQTHFIQGLCLQSEWEGTEGPSRAILTFLQEEGSAQTRAEITKAHELVSAAPLDVVATWQAKFLTWDELGRLERSSADSQQLWKEFIKTGGSFRGWMWPTVYLLKIGLAALSCNEDELDTLNLLLEAIRSEPSAEESFQTELQRLWGCDLRQRARLKREAQDTQSLLLRTLEDPAWQSGWETLRQALR